MRMHNFVLVSFLQVHKKVHKKIHKKIHKEMKILTTFIFCFSSLFFCTACNRGGDFKSVSTDEFATFIADPDVQRVDVRSLVEHSEGHIPGSININVLDEQHFPQFADSLLDKARPVAVYCRSGRRSKKAAQILSKKGFQVVELSKGFNDWNAKGLEVEK